MNKHNRYMRTENELTAKNSLDTCVSRIESVLKKLKQCQEEYQGLTHGKRLYAFYRITEELRDLFHLENIARDIAISYGFLSCIANENKDYDTPETDEDW